MVRLQKHLADCGIASRRKCESLIIAGKVYVNGKQASIGDQVNPKTDEIEVNGTPLIPEKMSYEYFILNKPVGYLSTVTDPQKRKTVLDLIATKERVYPVGRLDVNSEGLMLLTNDGELAYRLTHPKYVVEKRYEVLVDGIPSASQLAQLEKGLLLDDGMTAPCKAKIIERKKNAWIEIKLHEGKKREIRRMMGKLGYNVIILRRTDIGPLKLSNLPSGKSRKLSAAEIQQLKKPVELS